MALSAGQTSAAENPAGYDDLVALYEEFRAATFPTMEDGVPDYSPKAMRRQAKAARQFLKRLHRIDDANWPISARVDWTLVLAEMRAFDFQHRVVRPWARDPAFYSVTNLGFGPKRMGAFDLAALRKVDPNGDTVLADNLKTVPALLEHARANLTEPRGDLTRLAVTQKRIERNVFDQLAQDAAIRQPKLASLAEQARDAVADFIAWLEEIEPTLPAHGGVGAENYAWFLRHVMLFPYDPETIAIIGEREFERQLYFLKVEEHEHRDLPMITPVNSLPAFEAKRAKADAELLTFLRREALLSVPVWFSPPPAEGPYVLPGDRDPEKGGPFDPPITRHFFRQAEDRSAEALRAHNLPGHYYDQMMLARDDRPIRGKPRLFFVDGIRVEGWATYLEDMILQAGMLDKQPKAREITTLLQVKRAARLRPELKLHENSWTYDEALADLTSRVPRWMGPQDAIARFDLELYLRQPGYGIGYYMGKVELEALLAEVAVQEGTAFDLGRFHDAFFAAGRIPISLIRWEMTGDGDQVLDMRREG